MRERPIIFSGPMVSTILAGRKTQTRRTVKLVGHQILDEADDGKPWPFAEDEYGDWHAMRCPYGQPGDRLWVRETWGVCADKYHRIAFRADDGTAAARPASALEGGRWRSPIHMPRCAARLTLEVEAVRVERLESITEEDARAEGVTLDPCPHPDCGGDGRCAADSYRGAFAVAWNKLNAKRAPWGSAPSVWVITFKPVREMEGR